MSDTPEQEKKELDPIHETLRQVRVTNELLMKEDEEKQVEQKKVSLAGFAKPYRRNFLGNTHFSTKAITAIVTVGCLAAVAITAMYSPYLKDKAAEIIILAVTLLGTVAKSFFSIQALEKNIPTNGNGNRNNDT